MIIIITTIMNPNNNDNYYMDTGDENVTYIPVKVKSNSNVFEDTDIIIKKVCFEQNAPPVYYAYKCLPIQFPLNLRDTQDERNSTKELDEYDVRGITMSTIVTSPQKINKSVNLPKQKLKPQFAHDKNINFNNRINEAQANVLINNLI
ncbi:hypothetical protein AGNV_144 [Anticarsia gemmatalis multiple nucleopolyhedrovirus]|uniref:Uncharacterized protein n=2 Tax=Anticarsia gemmatalis multiple nucleopolyhedrovirus TaxID=268591 RepID=A0A0S3J1V9_9ABAC|nr:hypothetical protein AGNV_144 [Anticarsia gemmatalis multiple nucleopolyhedrovirus]ALR71678.1 hypothetical protein AGNV_144 [Anticarsia gemmatalis multiple nucleopolyhedrovirus]